MSDLPTSKELVVPQWPTSKGDPIFPVWSYDGKTGMYETAALRMFARELLGVIERLQLELTEAHATIAHQGKSIWLSSAHEPRAVLGGDDNARCGECGMHLHDASEYHPLAACLMFRASGDREVVLANLNSVIDAGRASPPPDDDVRNALKEANELCRASFQVCKRVVEQYGDVALGVNFGALEASLDRSLTMQHAVMLKHEMFMPAPTKGAEL